MRRRAFLLVMVLFLIIIIFIMGIGFLGSRVGEYQSAAQSELAAQARALARSGIEDARTKFNHDWQFPPPPGVNETYFTYCENVYDLSRPRNLVGYYKVTVDSTFMNATAPATPYFTITSTGGAVAVPNGGPATSPAILATHSYRAYLEFPTAVPAPAPQPPSAPNQQWICSPAVAPRVARFDDLGSPTWGNVTTKGL